jgi:hypothetical protein
VVFRRQSASDPLVSELVYLGLADVSDLGEKPLGTHHRGEFGLQNLQRDLALVLEVIGKVDRRHAALAELTLNGVAAF